MSSVAVVGVGYVGIATAVGLAHLGHDVLAVDIDHDRVEGLRAGIAPFFEERLQDLLEEGLRRGRLRFELVQDVQSHDADFVFLCLPTPQANDGSADLVHLMDAVDWIMPTLRPGAILVNKSTVPVGTARAIMGRMNRDDVPVVSNPEFLQEGRALSEFFEGERTVIGSDDPEAARRVGALYASTGVPLLTMGLESAELAKYACNTFLATKLSFVNSIARMCESVGAEITDVTKVMGTDSRIGSRFLSPGPGWGGPCLPKDSRALLHMADEIDVDLAVLAAAVDTNERAIDWVAEKVLAACGGPLHGARVAVWGLTFKAGTDDLRNSPALRVVQRLQRDGANVIAFDPMMRGDPDGVEIAPDAYTACKGARVLVVLTEWPEFGAADLRKVYKVMETAAIVDTRNVIRPDDAVEAGFEYVGIGRPAPGGQRVWGERGLTWVSSGSGTHDSAV
jgi:UDPglucose 6-dehydrogenase